MPRTIPIASAALQIAFLVVCLAAFSSAAVAAPAHRHAARSSAHTATRSASHRQSRAVAVHASARATHRAGHTGHVVRSARTELKPRSAAARRAHSRIREEVTRRRRRHTTYFKPELRSARLVIPAPLRGSHESLVHQNQMAEAEGLERILDDTDLDNRIASGSLVQIPASYSLHVSSNLPENRRYCRPWTAKFLTDLSRAHNAKFGGSPLEVTSAVRTVEYQRHLRRVNGNAAAADGDIASPHLTGGTIDIGKNGLTSREIGWIRAYLIPLEQKGFIDVEEEFKQSCFHISVYRKYSAAGQGTPTPARMPVPAADGTMLAIHGR
ncbi:MAG TPA: DUF5715 family protein [Acidobacteriaceae bacterium]|nr:DUF5715 family protein [Acidobacteriaceae bacterium]